MPLRIRQWLLDRQAEWLGKGLVDLHVIFAVPREISIRDFLLAEVMLPKTGAGTRY